MAAPLRKPVPRTHCVIVSPFRLAHTFTVAEGQNRLALLIFLLVAVLVSRIVHTARRVRPLAQADRARTALLNDRRRQHVGSVRTVKPG